MRLPVFDRRRAGALLHLGSLEAPLGRGGRAFIDAASSSAQASSSGEKSWIEIRSRPVTLRYAYELNDAPGGIVVAINVAPPWVDAAGEKRVRMSGKSATLATSL